MSLVVLGLLNDPTTLDSIAQASGAREIRHLSPMATRLVDGQANAAVRALCENARLDYAIVPEERTLTDFGLFVTDMDSTLIDIECIDEVADMSGLKREVSEITEAAMRGEIDFAESLTRRVALLADLPESALADVFDNRLHLNPGAERLMCRLKAAGLHTVLVSGGFTYFTDRLRDELGFDEAHANHLEIIDGHLTGRLVGKIVDGQAKAAHLRRIRENLGLRADQVIAAGDGANDIPMLTEAGYAVAYRPKPVLRPVADCCLDHASLDAILDLFE